ncbi:hypothetical protein WJX72_002271 [[Myrmecia] bisecta]|uniref:Uncharacterized protein n=1 Tax=[Myrmecia] bisecta TaxID=41462 RepID=A0AAW1QED1_9CHLO
MALDWQNLLSGFLTGTQTQAMGTYAGNLQQLLSSVAGGYGTNYDPANYEAILAQHEQDSCEPATFTPSYYVPANYTGPGMSLTFSTGSCSFNTTTYVAGTNPILDCIQPAIVYKQTPAIFTSKYISPAVFTAKSCNLNITIPGLPVPMATAPTKQVLYVFGNSDPSGLAGIAKTLQGQMTAMFSGSGYGVAAPTTPTIAATPITIPVAAGAAGAGSG